MITRNMLTTASTIAILSAIAPVQAFGADAATPAAEVAAPAPTAASGAWTGFYAGFGVSASSVANDITKSDSKALSDMSVQGAAPSIEAGYDTQSGNFVFGVNANYDFGSTSNEFQKSAKTTLTETMGTGWGVGVRAGMLANDSTLMFASAGATSRNIGFDTFKDDVVDYSNSVTNTVKGRYIGVGMETKLTDTMSLTGEYRINRLDGFTVEDGEKAGKDYTSGEVKGQEFRLSIKWRF